MHDQIKGNVGNTNDYLTEWNKLVPDKPLSGVYLFT